MDTWHICSTYHNVFLDCSMNLPRTVKISLTLFSRSLMQTIHFIHIYRCTIITTEWGNWKFNIKTKWQSPHQDRLDNNAHPPCHSHSFRATACLVAAWSTRCQWPVVSRYLRVAEPAGSYYHASQPKLLYGSCEIMVFGLILWHVYIGIMVHTKYVLHFYCKLIITFRKTKQSQ